MLISVHKPRNPLNGGSFRVGVIGLFLMTTLAGCGWGYADKLEREARQRPFEATPVRTLPRPNAVPPAPTPPPQRRVTIFAGARDLSGLNQNHRASQGAKLPRDTRQHAFRLMYIDEFNIVDRWIHCSSGEVIEAKRRDSSTATFEAFKAQGIPPKLWVLRIDPSGERLDMANNDWYRHIVKTHRLEYVGRDEQSGVVTYHYLGLQ